MADELYEQLQNELERAPRHDVLIIMGHVNDEAREPRVREREMGRQVIGRMNENGERLAEFHAQNNLVICGKLFDHRDIHKLTWASPNGPIFSLSVGEKRRRATIFSQRSLVKLHR